MFAAIAEWPGCGTQGD